MKVAEAACRVCGGPTAPLGRLHSRFSGRDYDLRQCPACWYGFVANPWTEFDRIYTDDYYAGRGADPSVDYAFEFEHPDETVRAYEWRGLLSLVGSLVSLGPTTRWLDYGCGHAGLVRHARTAGYGATFGYDTGAMAATARRAGLPVLTEGELEQSRGSFDVVTAVEVIEHVPDPLELLTSIRALLKPGGLLLLTTGNARPYRDTLPSWRYVLPDVHVSFFEPTTLGQALERTGFRPETPAAPAGWADIIRFKVLKTLKVQRRHVLERLVPWRLVSRLVDARLGVSAHPVGWAR